MRNELLDDIESCDGLQRSGVGSKLISLAVEPNAVSSSASVRFDEEGLGLADPFFNELLKIPKGPS